MLVGLMGGTFDPVHVGHIHAALSVGTSLNLERIYMVLAARPGHRGEPHAPVEARWDMLNLACEPEETLIPEDMEIRRKGSSYTVDTLSEFGAAHSDATPCWILGQDAFATLPEWHRWRDILVHANLIVVDRPGDRREEPQVLADLCHENETTALCNEKVGQIVRLTLPMQEVSATEIRQSIADDLDVEHLLSAAVYTYIRKHKLYSESEEPI